jgi:site-specific DNA-methyltransferase (adenine-specific)
MELIQGDCLEVMKSIPSGSIDAIITDPPYGTTACKWDSVIPFELMWEQLNRIIKPNGAIVLFGSEPFSSALRMSNIKNYKYDWKWNKKIGGNPLNAKKQPLKIYEDIIVFNKHKYYPIKDVRGKLRKKGGLTKQPKHTGKVELNYQTINNEYYPKSIIEISNANRRNKVHPTQKPVALMEYLIKTYTNENETVLDFTMGSGSTMVACQNLNRNGIGIEQDSKYFKIAQDRVEANKFKLF